MIKSSNKAIFRFTEAAYTEFKVSRSNSTDCLRVHAHDWNSRSCEVVIDVEENWQILNGKIRNFEFSPYEYRKADLEATYPLLALCEPLNTEARELQEIAKAAQVR